MVRLVNVCEHCVGGQELFTSGPADDFEVWLRCKHCQGNNESVLFSEFIERGKNSITLNLSDYWKT